MLAQRASTFRLIGAGVTSVGALAAIFGAGGGNAQTLANLETDRAAYLQSQCGHIGDGAERVGCMAAKSIEFSRAQTAAARKEAAEHRKATAEHQKAIAKSDAAITEHQKAAGAARTSAQCLNTIADALTAHPPRLTPADVRAAKKTPTPTDDACEWVRRLQPRLGQLTKQ